MVTLTGGAAVSRYSQKQKVVACSTSEEEYISLGSRIMETAWLRKLINDVGVISMNFPSIIKIDKQDGIALTKNESVNRRTKHIDVRFHYNIEAVLRNVLTLEYCPTDEMIADLLPKALEKTKFQKIRENCGLKLLGSSQTCDRGRLL